MCERIFGSEQKHKIWNTALLQQILNASAKMHIFKTCSNWPSHVLCQIPGFLAQSCKISGGFNRFQPPEPSNSLS